MSTMRNDQGSSGSRIVFTGGAAVLHPPCAPPPGTIAASASVISPGTELRRMSESKTGSDQLAGYMNIAIGLGGEMMLAPEPHGAWMRIDHPNALTAPATSGPSLIAVARFQLIASAAMSHPAFSTPPTGVVVGSGPVALGCCLELLRRGTADLTLLTARTDVPFAHDLGVKVARAVGTAAVVIDATGRIEPGLSSVAPGGIFGLLGTPDPNVAVSALRVHRQGIAAIGMHELVDYDHFTYQNDFSAALTWLAASYGSDLPDRWCRRIREGEVVDHYRQLAGDRAGHGPQPITIVEWAHR